MKRLAIILSIMLLLTVACDEGDNPTDQETCIDTENGAQMTIEEALQIAQDSECGKDGTIKSTYMCNPDTGTWWIDLEIEKEGCNPACVVEIDDRTAEINWRCTGVIPE
ncbi:MAG: hypothetical protein HQ553_14480 [Chloroflexi bacterium]|nr:hypothetical protein [Chloroflexota bacterium]